MDKIQQLYSLMIDNGLLTSDITLDKFRGADESQQQQLYNLSLNSGIITADKVSPVDFKSAFSESAQESADFKRELVQAKGDVVDLIKQEKQKQFVESIPRDEAVVDVTGQMPIAEIPEQKIPVSPLPQKPVSQQIDELVAETSYKSPEKIAIEEREKTIREAEKEARRAEGFYDDKGFVEQFYGKELLSKTGIDVQEFTDFLIDEGLLNEMQDKMDGGLYERTFGESVNPDLTYDMDRFDAIRAYLSQKHSNELRDVYTEKQKNNRGYADYSISGDEVPKIGADVKELMSYVETNLPIYSQKIQEQEEKNKELYDQYKEDGIGSAYRIKTGIKKAYEGFDDALSSLSIGFYDLVGDLTGSEYFNNVSKSLIESERQEFSFEPYDLTYGFASGKEVFQDGIEYMVGDRGQVYDVSKNLNVTNLITPKEYASITSKANQTDRTTWSFSGTGTAANLANVMGDIGVQILYQASLRGAGKVGGAFAKTTSPGRATVNALKRIPIKRGLSEAIIAQSTLGYSRGLRDVYIEAKKSGLSDKEATELASLGAKQMGLLYALTAPIAQRTNITDRLLGEPSKKAIKDAVKEYSRTGNKGFVDVFLNLARNYKEYGAQGFKELLQENVQQAGERFVVNPNVNREARQRILEDTITFDEFINTSILSFLAGGLLPAGIDVTSDTYNLFKDGSVSKLEALAYLNGNQEKTERLLNSQVAKGVYTQTQVDKILKDMDNYRVSIGKMPRKTSPQAASSLLSDLTELSELELDKQSTDPVFHSEIDEKISNIRGRVQATIEFDQLSPESKLIFTEQATKNLEATKDQETNWEITSDETFDEARKLYYETKKLYQDVEVGVDEATQSLTDEGVSEPTQEQIAARQKELTRKKIDDAIQEREARDIPDVEPAEGVQEVEEEVRVTPEEEVEEERIKDSQIPKSKTIYTTKRDDGEIFTVEVTTRLDSSRTFVYKSKDGTYLTEAVSPDNTLTDQEYISASSDIGGITETKGVALENVMSPKMRERLSARQRAELGIKEEVEPQLYKLPETKSEWVKDFDIIDNRGGKADLEIEEDGKTGRWYVENNKTGRVVATKTKAEAQAQINNPTYDYGEGDPIITPTEEVETKIKDDAKPTIETPAGSRLFNEPLEEATTIANRISERTGIDFQEAERITKLDEPRARRIAQAFEALESDPENPEVKEAYQAMIDETIEQYNAIIEAGYTLEVNNAEPYQSSQEMIEDLRNNKNLKIFSTESGFGEGGVTDADRASNPLLAPTEFKDKNGVPLLANDIFRFVHDFFGHAKMGNGFGPIGEENAWNVHSRMYSPKARRAMTTETRGQNSWVNFSGVNDEAFKLRDEARALRKEGKFDEAAKKVEKAYELMRFADQKIVLLPEEFTKTDDEIVVPEMTQEQINELSPEELATRSNQLEAKINKIFKGKYEATVGGRRVGRKISPEANDRIKIIQDNIVSENIQDKNQSIIEAIDELQSKTDLSQSDIEQIVNLETALAYNEASEMDEQNPSRLFNLMNVDMNLSSIIEEGKTQRAAQVAEDVERRREIISKGFEDITGMPYTDVSGIESEADRKAVMDQKIKNNAILAAKAREREATNKFVSSIRTFIAKNEDLDGLVDIVSKSTGDFLGGSLQEIISDRLFDSSIEYKRRNLELKETLSNKLQELFGKNFSKTLKKFSKETENLQIADDVTIPISQNKLMYLYNQYKDEANHPGFESQFGSNYAEIMERAEQMLDPRLKEFADYQVDELFPQLYNDYNEVYRKIYRTNLPWNRKYAGRLYRVGDPFENLDLLASPQAYKASIAGASTKARVKNKRPIEITDGMDMLYSYLNDMEFFRAYAESMKDVNRLMGNPDIKLAIEATSGPDLYRLLTQKIQTIANRGAVKGDRVKFVNLMNDAFVLSRLGVNPTVALKQLTSTTAYAADIGVRNWTSYAAKAMPEIASVMKEITDNSVYLKDRYSLNIKNVLEAYNTGDVGRTSPINGVGWADILMYLIKQGDRGAIILGGAPNYLYHKDQYKAKNPKATEEEVIKYAIRKFERETDKAQQSSDIASKDLFQTAGDLTRAFNLFLTTPKQYQRKVNSSIRQIYRKTKGMPSKGTLKDNLRNLFVYHVWLPVVFQYVTLGLPGILSGFDEEDKEDLIRAAILGNINAFFVVGGLVSSLADYIQGKPWAGRVQSLPVINVTQNLLDYGNKALTSKKQDTRNRFTEKFLTELAMTGGIPAGTLLKLGRNWSDVITGKTDGAGESILKLLGYSDYVVTGGNKNNEIDKKLSKRPEYKQLKKTNPKLYNALITEPKRVQSKGSLDSQLKAQEKAMNDLLGIIEEEEK